MVGDIAVYCEQILDTTDGGQGREQALRYLARLFDPGGVVDLTLRSCRTLAI